MEENFNAQAGTLKVEPKDFSVSHEDIVKAAQKCADDQSLEIDIFRGDSVFITAHPPEKGLDIMFDMIAENPDKFQFSVTTNDPEPVSP